MKGVAVAVKSLVFSCLLLTACFSPGVPADQQAAVSPLEMMDTCAVLNARMLPTVEKMKADGTPLQTALTIAQRSVTSPTPPADITKAIRSEAALEELIKQIYKSPDSSPQHLDDVVRQSCRAYAPEQYTAQDMQNLYECMDETMPYAGIANARDHQVVADVLLAKAKQQIYGDTSTSVDVKAKRYEEFSAATEFAYAHPEMTGKAMGRDRFTVCYQNLKGAQARPGVQ